jgi:DNA-binding LacI/PurR family transcriptional regulator
MMEKDLPTNDNSSKPKHAMLAEALSREIRGMPPGAPIQAVTALMAQYQVSQGTVVHALRHLRAKGLIVKPPGRKRLVAVGRPLKSEAVLNILLLRPHWSSPDYDAMSYALLEEAGRQRLQLEMVQYGPRWWGDLNAAVRSHDAAVILPSAEENAPLLSLIQESHIPAVMLWEQPSVPGMLCVADDDFAVGQMATSHLLGLGHKNVIAFLSEPAVSGMQRRLAGWEHAVRAAGVAAPENLVVDCSVEPGKDSIVGSYEKLRRWLHQNDNTLPGTAVFSLCWTGALGMLRALREIGIRVPEDVSILSHGGESRLCEFSNPALSVIQASVSETARHALGMLKRVCLGDPPEESTLLLRPEIISRESTQHASKRPKK